MKALKCEYAAVSYEMSLIGMQAGGYVRRFYKEKGFKRKKKVLEKFIRISTLLREYSWIQIVCYPLFIYLTIYKIEIKYWN